MKIIVELNTIYNDYNKNVDKILFENIDKALDEQELDIIDIGLFSTIPQFK